MNQKTDYGNSSVTTGPLSSLHVPERRLSRHPTLTKIDSVSEGSSDGSSKDRSGSGSYRRESSELTSNGSTSSQLLVPEAFKGSSLVEHSTSGRVRLDKAQVVDSNLSDDTDAENMYR